MNKKYYILIFILLVNMIFSCTKEDESFAPVFENFVDELTFNMNASSKSLMINTNRNFNIQSSESWCTTEILPDGIDNLQVSVTGNGMVGKQRTAAITASSEGFDDIIINVIQNGIPVVITCSEGSIVLEDGESTFSLTITTNVLIVFTLPEWIQLQSNDTPEIGEKTYHFNIDAIQEGEIRTGDIIVNVADSEIAESITIPVTQGKEETYDGPFVNNSESTVVEAEDCDEGWSPVIQDYWASSGIMFGDHYYIKLYKKTATYHIKVADAGTYEFTLDLILWGTGTLTMLLDNQEVETLDNIPSSTGKVVSKAIFQNVSLTTGDHVVTFTSNGNFDFDLFTIAAQ